MAINEHWGFGFEVNRDPNGDTRRDNIPHEAAKTRATGRIGAHSAKVKAVRPQTHELDLAGLFGLGSHQIHVPQSTLIHYADGRSAHLGDISPGDRVAVVCHEVEHQSQGVGDESGGSTRYEAVHVLIGA